MSKYKVTLRVRGSMIFEVEGDSAEAAEEAAFKRFDEGWGNPEIDDADVRK